MVEAPLRLFQLKTRTLSVGNSGNSISRSPLRRGFLFIALALAWLALSPAARAVDPAPDGGYPNQNTAEGDDALFGLTTGLNNTAIGFNALYSLTHGSEDTATGSLALANDRGFGLNTAYGFSALNANTTGVANTAIGRNALLSHITGDHNTATGWQALFNDTGDNNTGDGAYALFSNTTGHDNTAMGRRALDNNTTGNGNIALGVFAGANHTTGDFNIDIGNRGTTGEANTIRIGTGGAQTATFIAGISGATVAGGVTVIVDANGHLGTVVSSERFKDAIKPMDKSSEAILALQPVTFRYKHELDPVGIPQFGLVAEEVAKVSPDLVARDKEGKVYTVRYEAVNTMLLNEFLKEHRKVEEQEATITQVKSTVAKQEATIAQQQKNFQSTIAQQQKEIGALTTGLQKVSDELVLSKPAPQMVLNNH